jgi:hypothetical protein
MPARVVNYSTTLPSTRLGWRRGLGYTASGVLHIVLLVLIFLRTTRQSAEAAAHQGQEETVRPVQLAFAPPRPVPTPRPPRPESQPQQPQLPPAIPISPGPDQTPGSTAQVTPKPEERPNADPNTTRTEATRPDPGDADRLTERSATPPPPNIAAPSSAAAQPASASLESEAQRIFGRPSSKLGPVSGSRDNRPWESPVELASRGCTVPADEKSDSTLPPGMGVVVGKIYDERTGKPLAEARLQILGTEYGAFANERGEYKLYFDRKLVDRCRSQSVRVSAPGYPSRDVLLYIGATPNGDVPLSRY